MKHKLRFSFGVFMLILLWAGTCFGVTVRGVSGDLALSQIPDIIRHVAGNASGDIRFGKDSLFMYGMNTQYLWIPSVPVLWASSKMYEDIYSFNNDGSNNHSASLTFDKLTNPSREVYSYSRALSVLNTSSASDNKARMMLLLADNGYGYNGDEYMDSYTDSVPRNDDGGCAIEHKVISPHEGSFAGFLADAKTGISVKGYDGEVAAVCTRNGAEVKLYLGSAPSLRDDASKYAYMPQVVWSKNLGNNLPTMADGTIYFPVSMAVGDFDKDGYSNEIVVVENNRAAVHYNVLQISHTGSTSQNAAFSVSVLNSGDVGTYRYDTDNWAGYNNNNWQEFYKRAEKMDGLTAAFSHYVAAGDFDGDGQTEFAVVWRDHSPQNRIFNNYERWWFYNNDEYHSTLFRGYTGKIHVKTYKWNGSAFQTDEDVQGFDSWNVNVNYGYNGHKWDYSDTYRDTDVPLGVKAAVGDFDGDGRAELAVLRIMLQFTEHYGTSHSSRPGYGYTNLVFGAFVDLYTFDQGSIKPKYNRHSKGANAWNYGDNRNGWVGLRTENVKFPASLVGYYPDLGYNRYYTDYSKGRIGAFFEPITGQPITGESTPYPVLDREFDIIAGKFSGRVGVMTTCDDLVIKYPKWAGGNVDGNKLRSHVALMTNIPGVTNWGTQVHEITALSERDHALAFAKADYLGEGVMLGDPVKITYDTDRDYTAVLQMFPYHVDNLTSDGSALTKDPQSFTLRLDTSVTYSNTSSSTETKNLTYGMTKVAETIFAVDDPALRTASKTFQGVRGIVTSGIFSNDIVKKMTGIGKIWDKLKDTVETTTSTSNEHSQSYTMTITTQANYQDTLYMNHSTRYLWRYPVLEIPAPAWLMGQTKDTMGSFDKSRVTNQQSYITFAMSEPSMPVSSVGVNDSYYQPYHERGNLFSYPAALEQIEGYKGGKSIADKGPREWNGAAYEEVITLTSTVTSQDTTKKVNKVGAITKFLSAIDNLFGSSLAHIPQNSESSFTRSVTNGESIKINVPAAYSGAGFTTIFDTYLDEAGTMTTGFAVKKFRDEDALWGRKSLYTLKPDPSLLLPEKFNYTVIKNSDFDRAAFTTNTNDQTAIKMRGTRFSLADYGMETDNIILMKGLKYTINVPVYNASFKDAENFKVRLSYAKTSDYSADKTAIGDYTFANLPGWGNGDHRQTANFTWTPDSMDEGIYYLFAEIDPENVLDEVHENRRSASGDLIDAGGNNMGYWKIGIASSNSPVFNRESLESSEFHAADSEGFVFPYVHWVKAGGLDLEDFIKQKVDGASEPVPAEVELKYGGDYLMTRATLVGYKLKPESKGKDISEVTDADIGLVFVDAKFAFFPGEDHKLHFRINPAYLEDGIGFALHVHGEEYPLTDIIYGSAGGNTGIKILSSSGGCESSAGSMAGVLALIFIIKKRTR